MANDSTTLGFMRPTSVLPVNDRALEDIFAETVAGITGLDRNLVRPRWQPETPNQPDFEEDWCALGVNITEQDVFPYQRHIGSLLADEGETVVERDEFFDVLCSFYGANSNQFMSVWREGLALDQNRWALREYGIKILAVGKNPVQVPALLKNHWTRRIDLNCQFSRRVKVTYNVRSIQSAEVTLHTEELPPQTIIINQ